MFINRKALIAVLVLACMSVIAPASMAGDGNASRAAPSKFVGTYFGESGNVLTFHADGTMTAFNAHMFSDDPDNGVQGRRVTPKQGVWRKVAANEIEVVSLSFLTEPFGHDYFPNGVILKVRYRAIFDDPVGGLSPGYTTVDAVGEIFLPGQNPTTDEPVVVFPGTTGRGYRLVAD